MSGRSGASYGASTPVKPFSSPAATCVDDATTRDRHAEVRESQGACVAKAAGVLDGRGYHIHDPYYTFFFEEDSSIDDLRFFAHALTGARSASAMRERSFPGTAGAAVALGRSGRATQDRRDDAVGGAACASDTVQEDSHLRVEALRVAVLRDRERDVHEDLRATGDDDEQTRGGRTTVKSLLSETWWPSGKMCATSPRPSENGQARGRRRPRACSRPSRSRETTATVATDTAQKFEHGGY